MIATNYSISFILTALFSILVFGCSPTTPVPRDIPTIALEEVKRSPTSAEQIPPVPSTTITGISQQPSTAVPGDGPSPSPFSTNTATYEPAAIPIFLEGHVAFVSDRDGPDEIYIMNGSDTTPTRLTNDGLDKYDPTWSNDGKRIAYLAYAGDSDDHRKPSSLFVIESDGSSKSELTPSIDLFISSFKWSPDDRMIALVGSPLDVDPTFPGSNIYLVNVNNRSVKQITESQPGSVGCWSPSWSPDGIHLVYLCRGLMTVSVVISQVDGMDDWGFDFLGQLQQVTWLPSGEKIGFIGGQCEIGTFSAEYLLMKGAVDFGAYPCLDPELEALHYEYGHTYEVLWSSVEDMKFVVQSSDLVQFVDLSLGLLLPFQVDTNGLEGQISWGPGEDWLLYSFNNGSDVEIGALNMDDGISTQLMDDTNKNSMPSWTP